MQARPSLWRRAFYTHQYNTGLLMSLHNARAVFRFSDCITVSSIALGSARFKSLASVMFFSLCLFDFTGYVFLHERCLTLLNGHQYFDAHYVNLGKIFNFSLSF